MKQAFPQMQGSNPIIPVYGRWYRNGGNVALVSNTFTLLDFDLEDASVTPTGLSRVAGKYYVDQDGLYLITSTIDFTHLVHDGGGTQPGYQAIVVTADVEATIREYNLDDYHSDTNRRTKVDITTLHRMAKGEGFGIKVASQNATGQINNGSLATWVEVLKVALPRLATEPALAAFNPLNPGLPPDPLSNGCLKRLGLFLAVVRGLHNRSNRVEGWEA